MQWLPFGVGLQRNFSQTFSVWLAYHISSRPGLGLNWHGTSHAEFHLLEKETLVLRGHLGICTIAVYLRLLGSGTAIAIVGPGEGLLGPLCIRCWV